jgi:hypothetical protein
MKWLPGVVFGLTSVATPTGARVVGGTARGKDVLDTRGASWKNVSPHYLQLETVKLSPEQAQERRRRLANLNTADPPPGGGFPYQAGLTNMHDIYYMANITVGSENVAVSIDTGSSDTWFVKHPFLCVDSAMFPMNVGRIILNFPFIR